MQDLARATRIAPGSKVDLDAHPPDARLGLRGETTARERTAKRAKRMADLATMLMAEHKRAVLVVLQGMDASGKDGTVKHCLGGLNPMSVRVAGFKAPNSTELAHDFLWRIHQVLPSLHQEGCGRRALWDMFRRDLFRFPDSTVKFHDLYKFPGSLSGSGSIWRPGPPTPGPEDPG